MIKRRFPFVALQKAVYSALSLYQTTPIYDQVPDDAGMPYITIGSFTSKNGGTKDCDIAEISQQLAIWSNYQGKAELNQIANDIAEVLTAVVLDLSTDGFSVMSQDVDMMEAFGTAEDGFFGAVTFVAKIQNIK